MHLHGKDDEIFGIDLENVIIGGSMDSWYV